MRVGKQVFEWKSSSGFNTPDGLIWRVDYLWDAALMRCVMNGDTAACNYPY